MNVVGGMLPRSPGRHADILLVEDNARDVRLVREVMRDIGMSCNLHVAADGAQALRMLRREGAHSDLPTPDLVLLDINLPILSGIEVLQQIKNDSELRVVPVLILTTSRADSDVLTCYSLNANTYLVKPSDFDEFTQMMSLIQQFWVDHATLPPARRMFTPRGVADLPAAAPRRPHS